MASLPEVLIVGRPNVGKSTLLNAALEQRLSIVSPTPQTSRDAILGVVHRRRAEIALLDTPGLHRPRTALGARLNEAATEPLGDVDVVLALGVRFSEVSTGFYSIPKHRYVIHVDTKVSGPGFCVRKHDDWRDRRV